jgi:predicted dehydrogenase
LGKTYNIAVIGAGDMGGNHVSGWLEAGHKVYSITDVDIERANELAEKGNIPNVLQDFEKAVSDPEVDIVSICLPLVFHAPVTVHAANRGKHVFCEKPLASSFADVKLMEEAVRRNGVQFGLGFQRNYSQGVEKVQKWVKEGKFGSPLVFSSDLLQEVRPKRAMHDKNGNQGPIVDTSCHFFLMWETVFGSKPKKVYARGGILAKDRPEIAHFNELAVDTAVITVEYESGDIGTMTISWGLNKGFQMQPRTDRIFGPRGGAEGAFNTWGPAVGTSIDLYLGGNDKKVVSLDKRSLFKLQFEDFTNAIEKRVPVKTGFKQGKEMLALSHAVLESIETGKVITL